jgi:hypothetical protein
VSPTACIIIAGLPSFFSGAALGNSKGKIFYSNYEILLTSCSYIEADIVKMLDSQPDLAPLIRRVRGGYLKIQGTWMPYEVSLILCILMSE